MAIKFGGGPSSGPYPYKLKIGDVVLLKSDEDQPRMTVSMLAGPLRGQVVVQWRDKAGKPQAGQYHEDMLKLADESAKSGT